MKWKKLMSGVLSAALVVTSITPVGAAVTEDVTVDETVEEAAEEEVVAEESTDLALSATPDAFYTSSWESLSGINDSSFEPASSSVGTGKGWGCWGFGSAGTDGMWVSYSWDSDVTISGNEIYWYDNSSNSDGGVQVPSSITMQYYDNGEWKDATITSTDYLEQDCYNTINIEPVTTDAIRVKMVLGAGAAVGIYRWKVYGEALAVDPVKVAKKSLQKQITAAESYNENKYTADSWAVLKSALESATAIVNSDDATEDTIAAAADALTKAVDGLVKDEGTVKSIDHYKTTTAAGVAPILPDSVVANGLTFDDDTTSYVTANNGVNLAETFDSKLIPVTWEAVDPSVYAEDKAGTTFTVKGTATYNGESYDAYADITVNEPAAVAETNTSVTFENVQIDDDFWSEKQETNAITSLSVAIEKIGEASGGEPNFDNAIKKLNGESYSAFSGYVFQDSDIYKSIEAISYTLSATQNDTDEEMVTQRAYLEETLNRWIEKIEKVQYADGYIDTFFTLRSSSYSGGGGPGTHRWRYLSNHEMYVAGHFLESVVAYTRYREGIGDPDYRLYVAGKRFADEIVSLFGPDGTRHEVPGHEEIELALVKFGKLAQEYEGEGAGQKYYDTAQTLIDRRGEGSSKRDSGYSGGTYSQDSTALVNETTAKGHSVRAMYYYTGATDVAALLPDGDETKTAYMNSLETIWDAVENRKTYITGGIGTTTASSDSEGFGDDYELPSSQSYAEICAAIGATNWNQRMNLLFEDAKYADVVERNLYNSVLVGENLDGNRFYYSTLLETESGNARSSWFSCACCPPNLMRTIAQLSGYMYTVHNDNLFVNMYVGSTGNININGTNVKVTQETEYPWDGAIKMTIDPDTEKAFTLKVRIPGWVSEQKNQNVTIKVNGESVSTDTENGYVSINRTWKQGDVVMIDIPMEIRLTEADENVTSNEGRVAIERGPIVYCMENAGNVQLNSDIEDFSALNFVIPRDAELTATYREDLLKGVVEITGDVKYFDQSTLSLVDAKLEAIPYYAWNNRGNDEVYEENLASPENNSSTMLIWTSADSMAGFGDELRDFATPSVSYVGWGMGASNFADNSASSFWNGHGDSSGDDQWMMYDFGNQKVELTACSINFYNDGGVVTPNGVTIEYTDENGEWQSVTPTNTWSCKSKASSDAADVFEFMPVQTTKIRVTMQHYESNGSKSPVAVFDWKVTGKMVVDKAELQNSLGTTISEDQKSAYTESSWNAYETALKNAQSVLDNDLATQEAIDAAIAALAKAEQGLVKASDQPETPDATVEKPAKVKGVKATVTTSAVKLTWKKVAGADGYQVSRYNAKTKKYEVVKTVTAASYTDKKLKAGTAYSYKVSAYKAADGQTVVGNASAVVKALTKPAATKITSLKKKSGKVTLKFKSVSKATSYIIYKYNAKKKKYEIAYKVQGKKLYSYTGKKYKKVGTAKVAKGVYTTVLKKATKGQYRIVTVTEKKGYKKAVGAASKTAKLK